MQPVDDFLKRLGLERSGRPLDQIEEELYAYAALELDSDTCSPGLMAKAFSEAEGDEKKAEALYIKLRVVQLKAMFEKLKGIAREEERLAAQVHSKEAYQQGGIASRQPGAVEEWDSFVLAVAAIIFLVAFGIFMAIAEYV